MPIIIGLTVLYGPSLVDLFSGIWRSDEQMHGPIVLAISIWLIHRKWPTMLAVSQGQPISAWGWPDFGCGLALSALGRSQDILMFEVGSAIWLLAGLALLQHGRAALTAQWIALFFMLFMVPLPGAVVDSVTMPMKKAVSYVAEQLLFWAGYGRVTVMALPATVPTASTASAGLAALLRVKLVRSLLVLSAGPPPPPQPGNASTMASNSASTPHPRQPPRLIGKNKARQSGWTWHKQQKPQ